MLSCDTGACDAGFAQNLINKMGVPVQAPAELVWAYGNGRIAGGVMSLIAGNDVNITAGQASQSLDDAYFLKFSGMQQHLDATKTAVGIGKIIDFTKPGTPISNMLNEGVVKSISIKTGDGWLTITRSVIAK